VSSDYNSGFAHDHHYDAFLAYGREFVVDQIKWVVYNDKAVLAYTITRRKAKYLARMMEAKVRPYEQGELKVRRGRLAYNAW